MNFETIRSAIMGILSGNPKDEPLHYGEVFGTWTHLSVNHGLIARYQTFINHIGDEDLKNLFKRLSKPCRKKINS